MLSVNIQPFEGTEKKLELILSSPHAGLRSDSDDRWRRVVQSSRSEIISKISTDCLDAYLLSESSLLVWEDRIRMITCGQTTLVNALPEILKFIDIRRIGQVFYEQKNNIFPREQPACFEDDLEILLKYFPGETFRLGPSGGDHVHIFCSSHGKSTRRPGVTLQVLMHDLQPDSMEIFRSHTAGEENEIERFSGLEKLYPHMRKDRHIFSPPGYSINGILEADYFTVHVTPQTTGSYASFESNIIEKTYSGILNDITSIFAPGRFSVVLTGSMDDFCLPLHDTIKAVLPGYDVTENCRQKFKTGYAATFLNYRNEKKR
jgi:S-adenosylmethionine decarboxylase